MTQRATAMQSVLPGVLALRLGRLWVVSLVTAWLIFRGIAAGGVLEEHSRLQRFVDETLVDLYGNRLEAPDAGEWNSWLREFGGILKDSEAQSLWQGIQASGSADSSDSLTLAVTLGRIRGTLQQVAAREMLAAQLEGDIERAREWRATIMLPKYASAVEGALALQRLGGEQRHREEVAALLAREFVIWQITRVREKSDSLERLLSSGRATAELVGARSAEMEVLRRLPDSIMAMATQGDPEALSAESMETTSFATLWAALRGGRQESWTEVVRTWRLAMEGSFPNLLSAEDVERRERIALKLLRLIPMEYRSGVRDGQITIPIEYREARSFTVQAQQIVSELMPVWRKTQPEALKTHGPDLLAALDRLERDIDAKLAVERIEQDVKVIAGLLQSEFGLAPKRAGRGSDVVAETELEIRALLGQSLAAAQAGQWRKAEALRLDAYIYFDLEIESRTLPRDPTLALRVERSFLDGSGGQPGIKAALDRRAKDPDLSQAYQAALTGMSQCTALLKVGLSPGAASMGTLIIVLREGLEAVVILAALLAGLRGPENTLVRRRVAMGAWLALAASGLLFVISQHVLSGLSRHGETLEAVISLLAVIVLLMVTNWLFHKVYWAGWNAKLRELSRAAQRPRSPRLESLALVGVGFTTIFREGFETTLFLQSLVLEAGLRPVLIGLALGGACIGVLGYAVFWIGAKLPYRRLLVFTGVLVITVLFTFLGSTTRLFQTVGWLPVHPIPGLDLPDWMGIWLGLYPTWEGLLIPFAVFPYLAGMWLLNKVLAQRKLRQEIPLREATVHSGGARLRQPTSKPLSRV